jgi:hypothetical protein
MVDRRADHGEIEPRRGADISVADFAQMQRETEMDLRLAAGATLAVARPDSRDGVPSGSSRG